MVRLRTKRDSPSPDIWGIAMPARGMPHVSSYGPPEPVYNSIMRMSSGRFPVITCVDGTCISVQAGRGYHSTPEGDYSYLGIYDEVEIEAISSGPAMDDGMTGGTRKNVPRREVQATINKHGGIAGVSRHDRMDDVADVLGSIVKRLEDIGDRESRLDAGVAAAPDHTKSPGSGEAAKKKRLEELEALADRIEIEIPEPE